MGFSTEFFIPSVIPITDNYSTCGIANHNALYPSSTQIVEIKVVYFAVQVFSSKVFAILRVSVFATQLKPSALSLSPSSW